MKKIDLPLILDTIFYGFAVFLLSLCITRYFRVVLWLSLTVSALLGLSAGVFCFIGEFALHRRRAVSGREQAEKDALMLHLALETRERVRALLLDSYLKDGRQANLESDTLRVDGELHIPRFFLEPLSADEVGRLLREYKDEAFTVCCNTLSPEAERLLFAFSKKCVKGDELYFLIKRTGTYPENLICATPAKRTVKKKLRVAFSKKNARPFFVGGLMLLIMSLFVLFPVYYLITGASLMVTAVFVRALGYA